MDSLGLSVVMKQSELKQVIQKSVFKERFNEAAQDISPANLMKAVGVSNRTVANWKQGTVLPQPKVAQKLSDYLDVSVDWLLGKDEVI